MTDDCLLESDKAAAATSGIASAPHQILQPAAHAFKQQGGVQRSSARRFPFIKTG